MLEVISEFPQQFNFKPKIEYETNLPKINKIFVCGMGGSHLAANLFKDYLPNIDLNIHSDYGLPDINQVNLNNNFYIFSSYSGNTEEIIDGYKLAQKLNLKRAVIAVGGVLLDLAKKDHIPYIQLPETGIQPRSALGFSFIALLKILHQETALQEVGELVDKFNINELQNQGNDLADEIVGFVPVIYTSNQNQGIAYNWKIKLNETGKIPAFYNLIPELCHNEMTGFDIREVSRYLSDRFYFLMIVDEADHQQNKKRFQVLFQLYHERKLPVKIIFLQGKTRLEKIFSSLLLADFVALTIAQRYGLEAEQVPMVEEFKRRIAQ